ncbi:MAG: DUF547 domain-containing protein [Gammaproteobacteria bacterium]|nr:DUF547 domain-containing protein [Gammaproteobacteria bacterium]
MVKTVGIDKRLQILIISGILMLLLPVLVNADEPDWKILNALLKENVSSGKRNGVELNLLDYRRLQRDARFDTVIDQVQKFPLARLQAEKERLAFYINAYNVFAIKMVLDHWPLESIKDAGSLFNPVWKKPIGFIDGKRVSLHEIEHEILRKMAEPRIHMAIVCASVSCPDLRNEAYTAVKLDQQLDEQSAQFLNNAKKGLRLEGDEILVSKIFDWFEKDFEKMGGVKSFISRYRKDIPIELSVDADLPYDWSLNIKH